MGESTKWDEFGLSLLSAISKQIEIVVGLVYSFNAEEKKFKPVADYAYYAEEAPMEFGIGGGISGQVVKDKKAMFINDLPEGYVKVISGLGTHKPKYLAVIPILDEEDVIGLFEIATFKPLEKGLSRKIDEISKYIGKKASHLE
jgi:putative methionine-R-sulfoxide reductase with GAF domain